MLYELNGVYIDTINVASGRYLDILPTGTPNTPEWFLFVVVVNEVKRGTLIFAKPLVTHFAEKEAFLSKQDNQLQKKSK